MTVGLCGDMMCLLMDPFVGLGITFAIFQILGMMFELRKRL